MCSVLAGDSLHQWPDKTPRDLIRLHFVAKNHVFNETCKLEICVYIRINNLSLLISKVTMYSKVLVFSKSSRSDKLQANHSWSCQKKNQAKTPGNVQFLNLNKLCKSVLMQRGRQREDLRPLLSRIEGCFAHLRVVLCGQVVQGDLVFHESPTDRDKEIHRV